MKKQQYTPGPVMMYGICDPSPGPEIETKTDTELKFYTETDLTLIRSLYEIVEGKGSSVGESDEDIISEVKLFLERYGELKEEVQNLAGHLHILYLTMKDLDNTDASDEEKFNALRDFIEKQGSSPNADPDYKQVEYDLLGKQMEQLCRLVTGGETSPYEHYNVVRRYIEDAQANSDLLENTKDTANWLRETLREIHDTLELGKLPLSQKRSSYAAEIKAEIEKREKESYLQSRQVEKLRVEAETNKQILLGIVGSVRGKPFAGDSDSLTMDEVINLLNAEIANKDDDLDDDSMYDVLGLRDTLRDIYEKLTQNNGDELTDAQLDDRISRRIKALLFERDQIGLDYSGPATDPPSPFNQLKFSLDHWCVLAIEREAKLKTMSKQLRIVAKSLPGDTKALLDPIADIGGQHDD